MSAAVDPATRPGGAGLLSRGVSAVGRSLLPILVVVGVIVALWYAAAIMMNRAWTLDQIERRGLEMTTSEIIADTLSQERPVLPTPVQVATELWNTTMGEPILRERRGEYRPNPRSLFFHAWQTLAPTMLGFALGTLGGILLAVGIVHNRAMDLSVMPWAIASQTIPILAIAPMIIVVLNSIGLEGLLPKSLISAYLSFFPVVVGMVKGLRSPSGMDLDLLRTYSASGGETFWKLRLPASVPFLFASLKVGIAAALVGTIVAELPTGARFGLGARLLTGSYYGQTIQIWSALFMAAICAAALVGILGLIERLVLKRMGFAR
ncbi:ABC transporter permease [Maritalea mobilis]|uniref:ABC transporter permease n=1 Tax=[Roseibacterium] beibuensis TaxID=1193142 RepID=A0ABP9KYA8_9RHOB|nr:MULTISPECIES: ABC transporter permease [Alphaproteobacteria]MBY6200776.1 ABC transporter permease [Maritalea mobilis]MCS6621824.1 ABC transporter permease [Roseibacterium beibuensis]